MLHHIEMTGVGPSPSMRIDLAPRLNLIAGDNGLGKSFLLDLAWWVLTRTWAGPEILPTRPPRPSKGNARVKPPSASVTFEIDKTTRGRTTYTLDYDWSKLAWKRVNGRPPSPGLVLYARVDGGFGVWDPARNYWRDAPTRDIWDPYRPDAFLFDTRSVWNGLRSDGDFVCKGLLLDWVDWQKSGDPAFEQLTRVLAHLSPDPQEPIRPGEPARVSLGNILDQPTLVMPYGDVPIVHASAGMRRVVAIAYLLVWAFREHVRARAFLGQRPEHRIIFLIDEIEAHLHPRWQRAILAAMLDVTRELAPQAQVQILATTHSPFVPLSVETLTDDKRDALWDLDLVDRDVVLNQRSWERRGDATGWATSELFDLASVRSNEGEAVIRDLDALYLRAQENPKAVTSKTLRAMDERLAAVLPELDPILARWNAFKDSLGSKRGR